MRLPQITLTLDEQLSEFDVWITSSTGEIRDTEKFQSELNRVTRVFEILRIATKDFEDESACNPDRISHTFIQELAGTQEEEQFELLRALASVLYLVTGKSDNNSKCQFYAGDSGSVSHKNVDQTTTSRAKVMELFNDAIFVEYVDGAGYFSSLNGDLKTILSMANTTSFFQIRTAAIRLRRELQHIGYITPLELEHALLVSDQDLVGACQFLNKEGYKDSEINRVIQNSKSQGFINTQGAISAERRTIARRYFLLDIAATTGSPLGLAAKPTGSLLVPGYGAFYGIKLDRLAKEAIAMAPCLSNDWTGSQILADITWLCDEGLTMSC